MMKSSVIASVAAAVALIAGLVANASAEVGPGPKGWYLYQVVAGEYAATVDRAVVHNGKASGRLASLVASPTRYGLVGQVVDAAPYHGKRVRFSAQLRTDKVAKWAGLFMRVDSPERDPKRAFATDAMERRPIRGTTAWTRAEIVLDVAAEASQIAMGVSVTGAGTVWIDAVKLEVVDRSVPTTNARPPDRPQNTDFED